MTAETVSTPMRADTALAKTIEEDRPLVESAGTAAFEHADPVTEAATSVKRAQLILDLDAAIGEGRVVSDSPDFTADIKSLAEIVRPAMPNPAGIREVTLLQKGVPARRQIEVFSTDTGVLHDALHPKVTAMGLPARTPHERGNVFVLLQKKHFRR